MRALGFLLALLGALLIALLIGAGAAALIGGALQGADWLDTPTAFTLMLFALGLVMIAVPMLRAYLDRKNRRDKDTDEEPPE